MLRSILSSLFLRGGCLVLALCGLAFEIQAWRTHSKAEGAIAELTTSLEPRLEEAHLVEEFELEERRLEQRIEVIVELESSSPCQERIDSWRSSVAFLLESTDQVVPAEWSFEPTSATLRIGAASQEALTEWLVDLEENFPGTAVASSRRRPLRPEDPFELAWQVDLEISPSSIEPEESARE